MSDDVLDLLRDRNPVPVDPAAPPIEGVLARLDETAAVTADAGRLGRGGRRARLGGWAIMVAGAAVAAAVVLGLLATHRSSPRRTTGSAGTGGLVAPLLRPGQAWYYLAIQQDTTPWQPPGAPNEIGPAPFDLSPASRAVVVGRFDVQNWITFNGAQRTRGRDLGKPRFIGSAGYRAGWIKEHRVGPAVASASSTTPGFDVGAKTLSYAQMLRFPTDPAAVLKLLGSRPPAADRLAEFSTLLESVPLLPAARAAVFEALARLPGITDLGTVRDPLGRTGIALAAPEATPSFRNPPAGPLARLLKRSTGGLPTRVELIFDPATMALLASETVLLEPSRIPGISTGYPLTWIAYESSHAVSASWVPRGPAAPALIPRP
jgi:hypothetical protein